MLLNWLSLISNCSRYQRTCGTLKSVKLKIKVIKTHDLMTPATFVKWFIATILVSTISFFKTKASIPCIVKINLIYLNQA